MQPTLLSRMSDKPGKFRLFVSELKRRKVTRLATIYAVTGLGFIEAMDIIGGRFLIPEGTIQLVIMLVLAGFPIAMILGWIFDLTSKGIERTKPLTPDQKASLPSMTWRPSWISVLLFTILIFLTFAFFTVPRPNGIGFKERDWILIADLENNTNDEVFDKSLMHALRITIDQSRHVSIFPHQKILEALQRMQVDNDNMIDSPIALEVAERENIKAVLLMTISELGGNYILSTRLLDSNTGENIRSRQVIAESKGEVLKALNKLSKSVRKDLGESLQKIHRRSTPLSQATTSSLEALKYLSQASEARGEGKYKKAIELLLKAIELDPDFALAHANLGAVYYQQNAREFGEKHFTKALSMFDRLTEREKLWIEAYIAEYRGNRDAAIQKYEILLNTYPNFSGAWFRLGYNLMRLKRYEESIVALEKSLEVHQSKDASVFINIASCYSLLQEYHKSIDYYLKAFSLAPYYRTIPNLNHEFGFLYVQMEELQKAREVFEEMNLGDDSKKAQGYRSQALLSMYCGKLSIAIDQILESTRLYTSARSGTGWLRNNLYLAVMYKSTGMMTEFNRVMKGAYDYSRLLSSISPWWLTITGKLLARNGDVERADSLLLDISQRINEGSKYDEASYTLLKGEIEFAKGNHTIALDYFKTTISLRRDGYTLESLANYYHQVGELDNAISFYDEIISHKVSINWEAQEYWIRAHLNLGKVYEELGNHVKALEYYKRFLEIWSEADKDLPDLQEAISRLAKLQELAV